LPGAIGPARSSGTRPGIAAQDQADSALPLVVAAVIVGIWLGVVAFDAIS